MRVFQATRAYPNINFGVEPPIRFSAWKVAFIESREWETGRPSTAINFVGGNAIAVEGSVCEWTEKLWPGAKIKIVNRADQTKEKP